MNHPQLFSHLERVSSVIESKHGEAAFSFMHLHLKTWGLLQILALLNQVLRISCLSLEFIKSNLSSYLALCFRCTTNVFIYIALCLFISSLNAFMSFVIHFELPVVERHHMNKFAFPCWVRVFAVELSYKRCIFPDVCVHVNPFKVFPPLCKPRSPQLPSGGWQSGLHEVDGWSHSRRLMHH